MVNARNFGLSYFFSLKTTNCLKQTFFTHSKTIKSNHQKVPVSSTGTDIAVLFKNRTGTLTEGTFFKQVSVLRYFQKVPCSPLVAVYCYIHCVFCDTNAMQ